ncbi:hypothetical protein MC7420_2693 [Coleofasciculus chthonoplastes PCC 7420]|uniref:Uncharacterized protein n=1 Tax=Coleofasciculus chthonoplastes PCC 7420 TaxID=118168 RepID=B4VYA7_9CYAN|nr:hypothetical protein MC7420_2693 [Coleofasciculus chthonoplastes PCC 7420]
MLPPLPIPGFRLDVALICPAEISPEANNIIGPPSRFVLLVLIVPVIVIFPSGEELPGDVKSVPDVGTLN